MPRELTPKQRQFIAAYQTCPTAVQAAITAGYSPRSAKHTAYALVNENKLVRAELDRIAALVAKESELTATSAMARLDADITQAKQVNQHSAVAKFRELQMKLAGLLREKLDITVERIDINGALTEARERSSRPSCDLLPPIDGQFEALPSAAGAGAVDTQSIDPPIYSRWARPQA